MRYSQLFTTTQKQAKQYDSNNATLLIKAGFIDQLMAGTYTFLPLGLRVLNKIENIIRQEMNAVAQEVLMPALSPKSNWQQSRRLDNIDVLMKTSAANSLGADKNSQEYILNPTHEDIITPLVKKFATSYKQLPVAVYQIQNKFRNELRVKSGLLRGREFRMKDLYSFHASKEDLLDFYEKIKPVYQRTFQRLGLGQDTVIALASGGDFTKDYSHEFQTRCQAGEDLIYHDQNNDIFYNKEVVPTEKIELWPHFKAAEVGNIFPLNTKFSQAFNYYFTDQNGQKQIVYMGSYGIGTTRVMGVIAEKFHDDKGLIWPVNVAPFTAHLISQPDSAAADKLYRQLNQNGIEVFWDERNTSFGQKLIDADLIGCPTRLIISDKTKGLIEWKERTKTSASLLTEEQTINKLISLSVT